MDLSTERLAMQMRNIARLEEHLSFRIARLSKLLDVESALRLEGSGVNLTSYRILLVVDIFDEITISDISRIVVIDRAQISRAATVLIEEGYLSAKPDPSSKLKKLLTLTEAGREKFASLWALFDDRQPAMEKRLSADELSGLSGAIDKLTEFLQERIGRE